MRAFVHDCVLDTRQTVEDHGAAAAFDIVDGSLSEGEADGEGNGIAGDRGQRVSHDRVLEVKLGRSERWAEKRETELFAGEYRKSSRDGPLTRVELENSLACFSLRLGVVSSTG